MQVDFKFAPGDQVKHSLTKYRGIILAACVWLNGCRRYVVISKDLKDGSPVEVNFDEGEIELIKAAKIKPSLDAKAAPGGPQRSSPSQGR